MTVLEKQCHAENFRVNRRARIQLIVIHVMDGTPVGTDAFFASSPAKRTADARLAFQQRKLWSAEAREQAKKIVVGSSSAHYGIGSPWKKPTEVAIHRYVREQDVAFHAGSVFAGKDPMRKFARFTANAIPDSPNEVSVGIEHEGTALSIWPGRIYEASAWLVADIARRNAIPLDRTRIVGHNEIWPAKPCPGKCDLDRLVEMARKIL